MPYSIDTAYFAARAEDADEIAAAKSLRAELGWSEGVRFCSSSASTGWFKAPDVMIQIAAEAQARRAEIKLIMAGSGKMTETLEGSGRPASSQ